MFDNNFKEAEEYLRYAFEKCDRDSKVNKRLILIYLVPGNSLLFSPFSNLSQPNNSEDVARADAKRVTTKEV